MFFTKSDEIAKLITIFSDSVVDCFSYYYKSINHMLNNCCPYEENINTYNEIKELERIADTKRHEIIRSLLEGGLIPESRRDIMKIIEQLDEIANMSHMIILDIHLQHIDIKDNMKQPIKSILDITKLQLEMIYEAIQKIVSKYETDEMFNLIRDIENKETQIDKIEYACIEDIFDINIDLAEKMQLKELINKIGTMSDIIEDISDLIEIVMMSRKV